MFGAERLVEIKSAQVSGASYKTIGKYGLEWLTSLDAKAVVPAILNPIGMPRGRWEEMGIDPDFAEKQQAVVAAYERLGIRLDCTCTPYYLYEPGTAITLHGRNRPRSAMQIQSLVPAPTARAARVLLPRLSWEKLPAMACIWQRTACRRW